MRVFYGLTAYFSFCAGKLVRVTRWKRLWIWIKISKCVLKMDEKADIRDRIEYLSGEFEHILCVKREFGCGFSILICEREAESGFRLHLSGLLCSIGSGIVVSASYACAEGSSSALRACGTTGGRCPLNPLLRVNPPSDDKHLM